MSDASLLHIIHILAVLSWLWVAFLLYRTLRHP